MAPRSTTPNPVHPFRFFHLRTSNRNLLYATLVNPLCRFRKNLRNAERQHIRPYEANRVLNVSIRSSSNSPIHRLCKRVQKHDANSKNKPALRYDWQILRDAQLNISLRLGRLRRQNRCNS